MVKVRLSLPTPLRCSESISPSVINLGTGWRRVVNFLHPCPTAFCPFKYIYIYIDFKAVWAPEPVWTFPRSWKYLISVGNLPSIPGFSSLWPSRHTDHAVPA
jgi:hypothetical protein